MPNAAIANAGGAGQGAFIPFANEYAAAGSISGPLTVTSLNATLYGMTTFSTQIINAGTGK